MFFVGRKIPSYGSSGRSVSSLIFWSTAQDNFKSPLRIKPQLKVVTIKHVTFGASINLPPLFPSPSLFLLEAGTTQHSITSSCLYLTHPLHYYVIANRYYDWLVSKSEMCFPIKSPDWPKLTTINIHSSHCYHETSLHPNLLVYSSMSLNCSKRKG